MGSFLTPFILLVASGALLFMVTRGQYDEYKTLSAEVQQRVTTLETFKEYIVLRDKLLDVSQKVSGDRKVDDRINKMVPETIDTIRLHMDLYGIAGFYAIQLKDLAITVAATDGQSVAAAPQDSDDMNPSAMGAQTGITVQNKAVRKAYNIKFGFTSSYEKSVAFLKDLEKSLRIIDITNLELSPSVVGTAKEKRTLQYNVVVGAKTYGIK
jgi:hypothetical protein